MIAILLTGVLFRPPMQVPKPKPACECTCKGLVLTDKCRGAWSEDVEACDRWQRNRCRKPDARTVPK